MEAKPAAAEGFYKRFFKVCFPNVYRGDNYIAYYNFSQQCEDYFATAVAKRPNYISFIAFFL